MFTAFCSAGLWPGLGTTLAAELADAGLRAPEDVSVSSLTSLPRVGAQRAGRLLSAFIAAQPIYDLVEPLLIAGLSPRLAARTVDTLGAGALRLLRDDPWRLLGMPGVEVEQADAFARSVLPGVQRSDPRRSRALVGFVLAREARDGHTLTEVEQVTEQLRGFSVPDPEQAIRQACEGTAVEVITDGSPALLALTRYAEAEREIVRSIRRLIESVRPIHGDSGGRRGSAGLESLDERQAGAVEAALRHGVSILTGGPGTGKSRTVSAVVTLAERARRSVALAAPTGRAAKRLAELCDAEAMTIHRLLGAQPRTMGSSAETGTGGRNANIDFSAGFARGADWPLDQDVVVVDEASMLDVELAAALLRACPDGTHLLIVGDAAQLPSIGPGQVLADLIGSGRIPVTELTTLYRQDAGGAIAALATAVRQGDLPPVDSTDREVVIVPARGSAECARRVVQLMTDSIPRALGIAAEEIQVVTPVHRGPAGTLELNRALKAELNPGGDIRRPGRFDIGDRVVAVANHLDVTPNGFANGEVGVVTRVVERTVTIDFGAGPSDVSGKNLADIMYGWAVTVHRAQGSEFRAVIVVLPPEAARMLSRPLVYTALTRAREHLSVVHGTGNALVRAVREIGAQPRRTALKLLLNRVPDDSAPPVRAQLSDE